MIKVPRYFTKGLESGKSVYDMVEWKLVDIKIQDGKSGKIVFEQSNCEFPINYSQNACNIIASKYFRQVIHGYEDSPSKETSLKQIVHRMCDFWVNALVDEKLIDIESSKVLYDELAYTLITQKWAPNSPQWFNTGIARAYGLKGNKQGHFYFDLEKNEVVESQDAYTRTQTSACFILSLEDSMLGEHSLMSNLVDETRLFKFGSGVGSNWSKIRGEGEPLSGGGYSSGLISFLKVADSNAGAIKSGGQCLANGQRVYTSNGAINVKELAESCMPFIVFSYDPIDMRYKAKVATASYSGMKKCVKIITNVGTYIVSEDHPMMVDDRNYKFAKDLVENDLLFDFNCSEYASYQRIELKDVKSSKSLVHNVIANDILHTRDDVYFDVTHIDGNPLNNSIENLRLNNRSECEDILYSEDELIEITKQRMDWTINPKDIMIRYNTNQKVLKIEPIDIELDTYSVCVECETKEEKTKYTGHNFVIWPMEGDKYFGNGLCTKNSRRSSCMRCLDLDHPDIEQFIEWKVKEEDKVRALGKMGYSTNFNDEAYQTVSGQNSNNSVRITDKFMKSVEEDGYHDLTWRTNGQVVKTLKSRELFDKIVSSAWACGDPGVQFHDTINYLGTCNYDEDGNKVEINASNPCSEYMFLDDTACNLASINVLSFYNPDTMEYDFIGFATLATIVQLVLEASIHWGQFPTSKIAKRSHLYRSTGIGITNLASLLMCMAEPYDSDNGREIGATLSSLLTGIGYITSCEMAKEIGPFACYDKNKDKLLEVIEFHTKMANGLDVVLDNGKYFHSVSGSFATKSGIGKLWKDILERVKTYGVRNAQISVIAPTGTISFAMDCDSTSIEPFYGHKVYKSLSGGGIMTLVNPHIEQALNVLGYPRIPIEKILEYVSEHGHVEGAPILNEKYYPIFDTASKSNGSSRMISPEGHLKMMYAVSPHISGSISKTCNLSHEATTEDIKQIYTEAWRNGIKAISIYRDNSKASQPLHVQTNDTTKKLEDYTYVELIDKVKELTNNLESKIEFKRNKPSGIRQAQVHLCEFSGMKFYTSVTFYPNGKIAEIFTSGGSMGRAIKGLCETISTMISKQLQYGIDPRSISKTLRGNVYEPNGFVFGHPYIDRVDSISDMMSKIIDISLGDFTYCQKKPKDYVPNVPIVNHSEDYVSDETLDNEKGKDFQYIHGKECPMCHNTRLRKNGTCEVCDVCGTTTGCS